MEFRSDKDTATNIAMLLQTNVRVCRTRWLILLISGFTVMSNFMLWVSPNSIYSILIRYYVSMESIVTVSALYFLASAIMAIPGAFCVSRYGTRTSIIICAACNAIGSAFRVGGLARDESIFLGIGELIASFGTIFALVTPPQIAGTWFPSNERTFATTFGMIMNILGVSAGFLMSKCMVPNSDNLEQIGGGIRNMLVVQTLFCFVIFVLVLSMYRDKPPSPPCISESFRDELTKNGIKFSMFKSILKLLADKDYILVTMAYSLNYIAVFAFAIVLPQIVGQRSLTEGPTSQWPRSGWIGFISAFPGIASSVLVSFALDRHKRFKQMACTLVMLTTIAFVIFTAVINSSSRDYPLAISFVLIITCGVPYLGAGLDHITDIAYPISEGWSCMFPMLLSNVGSLTVVYSVEVLSYHGYNGDSCLIFSALEGIAFLLLFFVKGESGRDITYLFEELGIQERLPDM